MRKIELDWGKYDRLWTVFHVLSCEFGISPDITSLEDLEAYIRKSVPLYIENRHVEEPFGAAASGVQEALALFEMLKQELGPACIDYVCLPREQVTIDLTDCKYISEVYQEIRTKMEWDDDLGENLSALWDILWGMPYKGDDFTIIRPLRFKNIPHGKDISFTEYVDKICSIFQRAQRQGILSVNIKYTDESTGDLSDYLI